MSKFRVHVRYNSSNEIQFQDTLKRRIDEYFEIQGGSRKANFPMGVRVVVLMIAHFYLWSELALKTHSFAISSLLILVFSIVSQAVVCNVVHEAGHGSLTGNKSIDGALTWLSFNMLGPNARLFKIRHNEAHHMFTNIPGLDTDIEVNPVIRFVPHLEWKPIHRYQHIYGPILYSLFTLQWVFLKDFKMIRTHVMGNLKHVEHSRRDVIEFYLLKAAYFLYMVVIPAKVLPYGIGTILGAFAIYHVLMSLMITMTIASLHIFYGTEFVQQDADGNLPYSFIVHSLKTSADFHPESRFVGFFYSAFNTHVIHHMFPGISAVHFPAISKILLKTTKEYGLQYHAYSLVELYRRHIQFLKYMGSGPEAGKEFIVSLDSILDAQTFRSHSHRGLKVKGRTMIEPLKKDENQKGA